MFTQLIMLPFIPTLIRTVTGGQAWPSTLRPLPRNKRSGTGCTEEDLTVCTELLTRALEKNDLGFVTTDMGLTTLCRYIELTQT